MTTLLIAFFCFLPLNQLCICIKSKQVFSRTKAPAWPGGHEVRAGEGSGHECVQRRTLGRLQASAHYCGYHNITSYHHPITWFPFLCFQHFNMSRALWSVCRWDSVSVLQIVSTLFRKGLQWWESTFCDITKGVNAPLIPPFSVLIVPTLIFTLTLVYFGFRPKWGDDGTCLRQCVDPRWPVFTPLDFITTWKECGQ